MKQKSVKFNGIHNVRWEQPMKTVCSLPMLEAVPSLLTNSCCFLLSGLTSIRVRYLNQNDKGLFKILTPCLFKIE